MRATVAGRPTMMTVGRAALTCLVASLMMTGCGSDARTATTSTTPTATTSLPTVPSSTAATTTEVPASSAPSTSSTSSTTTSMPIRNTCDAVLASGTAVPATYSEAAFDHFGPLQPAPSLTIEFDRDSNSDSRGVRVTRIEGGVLVSAGRSPTVVSTPEDKVPIVAIGHDGAVRWSRCLNGHSVIQTVVAAPELRPANALVVVLGANRPQYESHFLQLSLATGGEVSTFAAAMGSVGVDDDALGRLGVADATDRFVLLADNAAVFGGDYRHIVRYDLLSDVAVDVGVPGELLQTPIAGPCDGGVRLSLLGSGDVILDTVTVDPVTVAAESIGTGALLARWQDGRWSNDPEALADAVGVRPGFACDDNLASRVVRGVDARGDERWSDAQFSHPGADDIGWYLDGDVAVGQVCSHHSGDDCDRLQLVGLDPNTGAVRWTLPGLRLVAGDPSEGYALIWAEFDGDVLEPRGWVMLDDRTGREVAGQRWDDPGTFTLHPSREVDGYNRTVRAGGLVLVVTGNVVQVWYPKDTAGEPHRIVLP